MLFYLHVRFTYTETDWALLISRSMRTRHALAAWTMDWMDRRKDEDWKAVVEDNVQAERQGY